MNLLKCENRKDMSVLVMTICLPIYLYFYQLYKDLDTYHWSLFITLLVFLSALKVYLYYKRFLQMGIVQLKDLRINIANVISYDIDETALRIVTNDNTIRLGMQEHQELKDNPELAKHMADRILKEFDIAFKYYKA